MDKVGERVKEVRKGKDLSQEMFADMLDVKQSIVSANERGTKPVSQRTIKAICREFEVSEEWLLTGKGDMYIQTEEAKIQALIKEYKMSPSQAKLFRLIADMPPSEVDAIISASKKIAEEFKNPLE